MKPFVAIIGGPKSGKSTVIQSLTGCPTATYRGVVTDRSTNRRIFVIATSPEESGLTSREFSDILDQVTNDNSILGLVMAIQPSRPTRRMSVEDIFQAVQATGRFSSMGFLLDPPYEGSRRLARHYSRHAVGARLVALGLSLEILDGRHFAHLNAAEVRRQAGLP